MRYDTSKQSKSKYGLCILFLIIGLAHSFSNPRSQCTPRSSTQIALFNFGGAASGGAAKIPSSTNDRDNQAINAVKSAIEKPRDSSFPLIECEFPALAALNKLGDGSLRSTIEAENANIAFASKLVNGISPPLFGPKVTLVISSSTSKSFLDKAKKVKGATVCSLKDGLPELSPDDVCVFLTPSSRNDYEAAKSLAGSRAAKAIVVVNGFAKDPKSIGGSATMAYFFKPLTYNSQVAGFLIRSYPSSWTVLDAATKEVLGSFSDKDILVKKTNTPDLRASGRLVQKSVDQRAIRARSQ